MKLTRMVMFGAAGAALAYFFDPEQGRRRRRLAADRASATIRRGRRAAERSATYASKTAAGMPAAAVSAVGPAPGYDDVTLAEKVKTELFSDPQYDGRVNVSAQNGVVVLIGEVEDPDRAVKKVKKIKGVDAVESLLHRPGTPAPQLS